MTLFAGVAVADYPSSRAWYESFFGRPPDLVPNDNEAAWQVATEGWVYIVGDVERAGSALVTVLVGDLDERLAALATGGIEPGAEESYPNGVRKVLFADPDGNVIALGEVPGG